MYSTRRTRYLASALIAAAAGLLAVALAGRAPAACGCVPADPAGIPVLPEVEVIAERLP